MFPPPQSRTEKTVEKEEFNHPDDEIMEFSLATKLNSFADFHTENADLILFLHGPINCFISRLRPFKCKTQTLIPMFYLD